MSGMIARTFHCEGPNCIRWNRMMVFADGPDAEKSAFDNLARSFSWTPTPTGFFCEYHSGKGGAE